MNTRHVNDKYEKEVGGFLQFTRQNGEPIKGTYYYPFNYGLN